MSDIDALMQGIVNTKRAISEYHIALNEGEFVGVAMSVAIAKIENALDMVWVPGEELNKQEMKNG